MAPEAAVFQDATPSMRRRDADVATLPDDGQFPTEGQAMVRDLLMPTTDAGVLAQAITAIVLIAVLLLATRRQRALRVVVVGGGVLVVALMALRAAH